MKNFKQLLLILTAVALFASCSDSDDNEETKLGNKEGILLVTFGSTFETPQETFKSMDRLFDNEFEEKIYWGYTSKDIRNKILEREERVTDSPREALERMKKDGFYKIAVQSLHIIPGLEYDEIIVDINDFVKENPGMKIEIGAPLLDSDNDMERVANFLTKEFKANIKDDEAVIFMGHGSGHANNDRYHILQEKLTNSAPNFYIGTVEANTTGPYLFEHVVPALKIKEGITKITLTPLMSVAGDHANNDMDGAEDAHTADDAEKSWKWQLRNNAEYGAYGDANVTSVMKGLATYPEMVQIWIDHLKATQAKLK